MKMKKVFALLLVVVLVFAIAACGKKTDAGNTSDTSNTSNDSSDSADNGTSSKINLRADGKQTVSADRATKETLQAAMDWQGAHADKFSLTYDDYVTQIGCNASEYEWSGTYGTYYWYASDDDGVSLHPSFKDGNGKLFANGSSGLSF